MTYLFFIGAFMFLFYKAGEMAINGDIVAFMVLLIMGFMLLAVIYTNQN